MLSASLNKNISRLPLFGFILMLEVLQTGIDLSLIYNVRNYIRGDVTRGLSHYQQEIHCIHTLSMVKKKVYIVYSSLSFKNI